MLLAVVRVNLDHFVRDLMAGDPVVWTIVAGVVFFSALGAYQKLKSNPTVSAEGAMECDNRAPGDWTRS